MAIDISKLTAGSASQLKSVSAQKAEAAQQLKAESQPTSQAMVQKDSVSLTQQAQSLGQMQKSMASTPSFNQEKVASIKKALENGEYKIDPNKVAQKLHSFEEELGKLVS